MFPGAPVHTQLHLLACSIMALFPLFPSTYHRSLDSHRSPPLQQILPLSIVGLDGTALVTVVARNALGCEVVANPGATVRVAPPSLSDIAEWTTGNRTYGNASTLLRSAYLGIRANMTAARAASDFESLAGLGTSALVILQVRGYRRLTGRFAVFNEWHVCYEVLIA
jgi:hypothetical protein